MRHAILAIYLLEIICIGYCESFANSNICNNILLEKDSSSYVKYKYQDSILTQTIKVKELNNNKIRFVLISKSEHSTSKISGIAFSNGGDYEIDESEQGIAYPAKEYIYNENCWLAIRIDAKTKARLQINEANCKNQRNQTTPFGSKGVMHKVDD